MENILEKLAVETNYQQYLQRMTASISKSSKGFIPFLVSMGADHLGYRILDVGCGSGVLMKAILEVCSDAEVVGVDLNRKSVEECLVAGLNAIHGSLAEIADGGEKFDCVIFSSVLHEISSYDEKRPFSHIPIRNALFDAYRCLREGGKIIIRDGVGCPIDDSNEIKFSFRDEKDVKWLKRFQEEFRAFDVSFKQISQNEIICQHIRPRNSFTHSPGEKEAGPVKCRKSSELQQSLNGRK